MKKKLWIFEKLWIGSQAVESFGLDHKKVKLLIVEKALDWITSCGFLRSFGLDHKKVKLLIVEKALDWITRK
jgi:S-ribosylhomocysteine lyase LuxS involved in autoinducer biosynthesis